MTVLILIVLVFIAGATCAVFNALDRIANAIESQNRFYGIGIPEPTDKED